MNRIKKGGGGGYVLVLHQTKHVEKLANILSVPTIRCKLPFTPGTVLNLINEGEQVDVFISIVNRLPIVFIF